MSYFTIAFNCIPRWRTYRVHSILGHWLPHDDSAGFRQLGIGQITDDERRTSQGLAGSHSPRLTGALLSSNVRAFDPVHASGPALGKGYVVVCTDTQVKW
jgi:hypothetical protein